MLRSRTYKFFLVFFFIFSLILSGCKTLEHINNEEGKEDTIPLCLIDFETLELHSMQGLYTGYFVRDYWVEFNFTDEYIELDAYYLPVRE